MKYLPLVWAALWRKPARTILTLLSVIAAFTLFGLAIGLKSTYANLVDGARQDRILVSPRFDGTLTMAQRDQIARIPGVTGIGATGFFLGYYRDPKSRVVPILMDHGTRQAWPELPLTASQWDQLEATPSGLFLDQRTADRLRLKKGDTFPVLTPASVRQDGSKLWAFTILGIVENPPWARGGLVMGNYDYFDNARLAAARGNVDQFTVMIQDPARAAETADLIDRTFASSAHPTWSISNRALQEISTTYQYNIPLVTEAVAAAGLFMILFLVSNGIAQSVRERIPEFAVLKTLGFSDPGVMALVFAEAVLPCLLGGGIGLLIAVRIAAWLPTLAVLQKMAVAPPSLSPGVLGVGLVFAVLVALTGAVLPAWRIRRLDVATALRR